MLLRRAILCSPAVVTGWDQLLLCGSLFPQIGTPASASSELGREKCLMALMTSLLEAGKRRQYLTLTGSPSHFVRA